MVAPRQGRLGYDMEGKHPALGWHSVAGSLVRASALLISYGDMLSCQRRRPKSGTPLVGTEHDAALYQIGKQLRSLR